MTEEASHPQTIFRSAVEVIRRALHASRVVSLEVANPHGPLGLEQLAAAVAG
jgi:hypothetical protein